MFTPIQITRTLLPACCSLIIACATPAREVLVTHVDAGRAIAVSRSESPLKLVVEIDDDGKLLLNRIDIGTVADTTILIERLRTVFEDREKASIADREVVIEMNGAITQADLNAVIDALTAARVSSILVTRKGGRED